MPTRRSKHKPEHLGFPKMRAITFRITEEAWSAFREKVWAETEPGQIPCTSHVFRSLVRRYVDGETVLTRTGPGTYEMGYNKDSR